MGNPEAKANYLVNTRNRRVFTQPVTLLQLEQQTLTRELNAIEAVAADCESESLRHQVERCAHDVRQQINEYQRAIEAIAGQAQEAAA